MTSLPLRPAWGWAALAAYAVVLAVILLNPTADPNASTVGWVADVLTRLGVPPGWSAGARVEFVLNALMFAPVPVLGSLALPQLSAGDWVASLFLGSIAVEAVQGFFLVGRSAQMADVVANTLGAALGAAVITAVTRLGARDVTLRTDRGLTD